MRIAVRSLLLLAAGSVIAVCGIALLSIPAALIVSGVAVSAFALFADDGTPA